MRKDILSSLAAKIGAAFFNFLVLIISSRFLGVELRGELAYTIAFALTVAAFISISLENGYVSLINNVVNRHDMESAFVTILFILSVSCFVLLVFIQHLFMLNLSQNLYLIAFVGSATLVSKCLIGLFLVDGDLYKYNISLFITRLMYLILSFISMYSGFGVAGVLFSFLSVQLVLILMVIKQKRLKLNFTDHIGAVKQLSAHSLKVHASTLGTILILQVPLILIGMFSTKANVAIFDTSLQVVSVLVLVISSLTPVVYSKVANSSSLDGIKSTTKLIVWSYYISTPITLLVYFFSEQIITILFGADYISSVNVLNVLLIMFWFNIINYFACPLWIMRGDASKLALLNVFIGGVNSLGSYYLISFYGISEVAVLLVLSAGFIFLVHFFYLTSMKVNKVNNCKT